MATDLPGRDLNNPVVDTVAVAEAEARKVGPGPEATFPIGQGPSAQRELAPAPSIDRYPIIIGQGLSLQYISAVFRTCLTGYRQQYVDLLDELLEKDGHLFSLLSRRIFTVASGKLEITPCETESGSRDDERAQEIADYCQRALDSVPNRVQHFAWLLWGNYYGLSALEIHWDKDGREWKIARLSGIHSRRLSYPDPMRWDLYVWDQGSVLSAYGQNPSNAKLFGFRIADYPNKFVVHAANLRGDYPTRDGLGRQVAVWVALKLIATRGGSQYLERFAKPWPEATFRTTDEENPRAATEDDIAAAETALKALGAGSLSSWVHPDTLTLDLKTPDAGSAAKLTFKEWIDVCNGEHSKAIVGGTLTTDVAHAGGNRALGDTQKKSELVLEDYDAHTLAEDVRRDLVMAIVRLNFPSEMHLAPKVRIHIADEPDPTAIIDRAIKLATVNAPVDADAVAEQTGVPLLAPDDTEGRRLVPAKMVDPLAIDPDLHARSEAIPKPDPPPMAPPNPNAPPNDDGNDEQGEPSVPPPTH